MSVIAGEAVLVAAGIDFSNLSGGKGMLCKREKKKSLHKEN
jgi:hypothetical protein